MSGSARRVGALCAASLLTLVAVACRPSAPPMPTPVAPTGDPVIAAAGDIACSTDIATPETCQQRATSDLLLSTPLTAVLPLGDQQYETGRLDDFRRYYDPTWGRVKSISHPVPSDHEYSGTDASGYFEYFGPPAGPPGKGYYSFDLGAWHLVALNGQCAQVGGCERGSRQETWLAADLAAHPKKCLLAYWDAPRFSTGMVEREERFDDFWHDLYGARAEIVLTADAHHYERFAPQDPDGRTTPEGIREFIVGTGGKNHETFAAAPAANSEVRNGDTFGVLFLTLHPAGDQWRFIPIKGQAFTDSGSTSCH
jgi:acid phosphatase type 7